MAARRAARAPHVLFLALVCLLTPLVGTGCWFVQIEHGHKIDERLATDLATNRVDPYTVLNNFGAPDQFAQISDTRFAMVYDYTRYKGWALFATVLLLGKLDGATDHTMFIFDGTELDAVKFGPNGARNTDTDTGFSPWPFE